MKARITNGMMRSAIPNAVPKATEIRQGLPLKVACQPGNLIGTTRLTNSVSTSKGTRMVTGTCQPRAGRSVGRTDRNELHTVTASWKLGALKGTQHSSTNNWVAVQATGVDDIPRCSSLGKRLAGRQFR